MILSILNLSSHNFIFKIYLKNLILIKISFSSYKLMSFFFQYKILIVNNPNKFNRPSLRKTTWLSELTRIISTVSVFKKKKSQN